MTGHDDISNFGGPHYCVDCGTELGNGVRCEACREKMACEYCGESGFETEAELDNHYSLDHCAECHEAYGRDDLTHHIPSEEENLVETVDGKTMGGGYYCDSCLHMVRVLDEEPDEGSDLGPISCDATISDPSDFDLHDLASEFVADTYDADPTKLNADDLEAAYTVARFVDAMTDIYHSKDAERDGVVMGACGRYAPEGIVGNYPPLWVDLEVTDALWHSIDALNSEHVRIHLIEQQGEVTLITLAPAL